MRDYSELLSRLRGAVGNVSQRDDVFREAIDAIEELLHLRQGETDCEPSDHEAEGAMFYVMSRARPAA
jgi:hypothetical protein